MKQGYIMLEDKLQGEYKEAFQQVEMYSSTNLIGADADSEMMMELLDHMLTAQEAGQPVSDIVGDDIKRFCKNFFSEYTVGDRFIDFLKGVYRIAWILFVFALIDLIFPEDKGGLFGSSDIGCVLIGAACGMALNVVVYVLIRPLISKSKRIKPLALNIFYIVSLIGTMFLAVVFINRYSIIVPRWISILIPAVYIICFKLVMAHNNYKKYGMVKAPKQDSISFKASVKASIEEELPGDWLKEFEKKNAKREKKGKAPLTEAEFLKKLDKQYNYRKNSIINYSIFGGCTITVIVAQTIRGFETILEFIAFSVIMILVEGGMCYFINKSAKVCSRVYHTMRKMMEEENLSLAEYVKGDTRKREGDTY